MKDNQDEKVSWLDFDPFGEDAEGLSVTTEGKSCPNCSKTMNSFAYRDSNIIIDKCSDCHGVWLDNGELEKIIEFLHHVLVTKAKDGYGGETFQEFLEIFSGSEGLILEAKDLLSVLYFLELRISVEQPGFAKKVKIIYDKSPFK